VSGGTNVAKDPEGTGATIAEVTGTVIEIGTVATADAVKR
jgi:hypothetical protein